VSALGQKDLVAEFDRLVHLAALDQVCVRFKDRVKLFGCRNLLSTQNAAAGLIDNAIA